MICNECNGAGILKKDPDVEWFYCSKCKGTGIVNWIENIFGKEWNFLCEEDTELRVENSKRYNNGS